MQGTINFGDMALIVKFQNVNFKYYSKSKKNDVDNINLELKPGKIIGLIKYP